MKMLIAAAAALSLTIGGGAMAQQHPGQHANSSKQAPAPKRAPAPVHKAKVAPKAIGYAPPRSWNKSRTAYQSHVRLCTKRYKGYNPRTNTYVVRRGKTAVCRL